MALYVESLQFNYSVYVNGQRLGQQGGTDPLAPTVMHLAKAFRIPGGLVDAANGQVVVAVRVLGGPVGFLNMPPFRSKTRFALVSPEDVPIWQSFRLAHDWTEPFALLVLNLLVGLCGLVIWWSLRDQREYLALAVWLLCNVGTVGVNFAGYLREAGPTSGWYLCVALFAAVSTVAELEFMRLLLRRRERRLWLTLEAIAFLVELMDPLVSVGWLPLGVGAATVIIRPLITELFVGVVLLRGAMRGNRDAPLLLLPVALWSLTDIYKFVQLMVWLSSKVLLPDLPKMHWFSYTVSTQTLTDTLGLLSLVLIILQRTVRLSHEKADLASEVAAAEELQLLLMARASKPTPGYNVKTEYRPMQQVGGDFFLVQPCEEDNSLVAIVGDVSGKGLQAAMRVSMILGVLQREVMGHPDRVLHKLNAALVDQVDLGFTTACCVRLESDGSFCFANAGHLNPYVNGQELVSEGALPLGIDRDAIYPVQRGRLLPRERMVLLSDGVIEARSRKGELFGFERTLELVRMDASSMADVAQRFGQEDDITVLSLALA